MNKFVIQKPWGNFEQFCQNENCTVKILSVNSNAELSYQYHNNRDEFWRVIFGQGIIVIDDQEHEAQIGDEFYISKKSKHRIKTKDSSIKVLEISFGEFDEEDVVRLEDKYGRV